MKKLIYTIVLLGAVLFVVPSSAQVSVQINIGSQPQWGPSGYDYARYYYMPEYDMYYDVQLGRYVYMDRHGWVLSPVLPARFARVDLYRTHKVVINDHQPWFKHKKHHKKYRHHASNRKQVNIREYHRYKNSEKKYKVKSKNSRAVYQAHPSNNSRSNSGKSYTRSGNSGKR